MPRRRQKKTKTTTKQCAGAQSQETNTSDWFAKSFGAVESTVQSEIVDEAHSRSVTVSSESDYAAGGAGTVSTTATAPRSDAELGGTTVSSGAGHDTAANAAIVNLSEAQETVEDGSPVPMEEADVVKNDGEDSDDDDYDDGVDIDPFWEKTYFADKMYVRELQVQPLEKWDATRAAAFVHGLRRSFTKYDAVLEKLADMIAAKRMDGSLLSAVDKKYVYEEILDWNTLSKRERGQKCLGAIDCMLEALESKKKGGQFANYWEKLALDETDNSISFVEAYKDSPFLKPFLNILRPLPRNRLKFVLVDFCPNLSVSTVDEFVQKRIIDADRDVVCKVVSASTLDEPDIVKMNLLYFKNHRKRKWQLLTSVDFAQHGAAEPGHWHVNRTAEGGFIAHSGMGDTAGSWHGDPDFTPLWWLFVPDGTTHHQEPYRLKHARSESEAAGSNSRNVC